MSTQSNQPPFGYDYSVVSRESGQTLLGFGSPLPKQEIAWVKTSDVPMDHPDLKDGLYLVRNSATGLIDLIKKDKYWYATIQFSEYCFISPLPEKWRLPR